MFPYAVCFTGSSDVTEVPGKLYNAPGLGPLLHSGTVGWNGWKAITPRVADISHVHLAPQENYY